MEYLESIESVIWMVLMGIVTGLLSNILVEIIWRKYMRDRANEIREKICSKRDEIYSFIRSIKKVQLPAPDWDEDHITSLATRS
jgi:hypothetical protein